MPKRFLILGFLALAVLATAVFFLRDPDPQAVLRQAAKNLLNEKTFHAEVRATVIGLPSQLENGVVANATGIDIVVQSDVDRTDPAKPSSVSLFEFEQGLASGGQAKLAGEARRKEGMHYVRVQALEGIQGVEASRVIGAWMKSERPFLDLLLAAGMPARPLDAAGHETLKTSVRSLDLFTVVETLPEEKRDGRRTYHYSVEMRMEAVSALLLKARELRTGRPMTSDDILAVTGELMQWNKPVGEVWIDAKTRKLKQITLGTSLGEGGKGGAAAGTLLLSDEGKPVAVEAPQAEDVSKVLGPLFEKRLNLSGARSLAQAEPSSSDEGLPSAPGAAAQAADSDGDGLSDAQESFYGADAWNPDTDGDGFPDGLEIEKGMNPVGPGALFSFGL